MIANSEAFTENEEAFIAERDSFYMASVSETGWPYVQYRGGPPGFLKVLDETTLAFADFRGNRQYISVGNLDANDRVALILVDYPRRARLKILAHVERLALDAEPGLLERLSDPGYRAKPERIFPPEAGRVRLEPVPSTSCHASPRRRFRARSNLCARSSKRWRRRTGRFANAWARLIADKRSDPPTLPRYPQMSAPTPKPLPVGGWCLERDAT
ncbi:pyridoxamine 5'-phosphate oxidase family protein [Caulobacter segnis]